MNKKGDFGTDQGGVVIWIMIGLIALLAIVSLFMAAVNKGWINLERFLS